MRQYVRYSRQTLDGRADPLLRPSHLRFLCLCKISSRKRGRQAAERNLSTNPSEAHLNPTPWSWPGSFILLHTGASVSSCGHVSSRLFHPSATPLFWLLTVYLSHFPLTVHHSSSLLGIAERCINRQSSSRNLHNPLLLQKSPEKATPFVFFARSLNSLIASSSSTCLLWTRSPARLPMLSILHLVQPQSY